MTENSGNTPDRGPQQPDRRIIKRSQGGNQSFTPGEPAPHRSDNSAHNRAPLIAGTIGGLAIVGAGAVYAMSQFSSSNEGNSLPAASTTETIPAINSTPPSLTTPDGRQIVITTPNGQPGKNVPTEAPKPTATTAPTATPTKEAVAEVPCLIVPEQYCASAERIIWNNKGTDYTYIGLKVPTGTRLSAPRSGLLQKGDAGEQPFQGNLGVIRSADNTSGVIVIGGIHFDTIIDQQVSPGVSFGTIDNEGTVNFGEYDLIITINNAGPNGPTTDTKGLQQLFPKAFENNTSKTVTQNGPSQFGNIKVYSN